MTFGPWKLMDVWRSRLEGQCHECDDPIRLGDVVVIDPETETVVHRRHTERWVVSADKAEAD